MRLGDLIQGLGVSIASGGGTPAAELVRVCDLTEDSRTVLPGSLFVARSGLKADGKRFAKDAVAAGAAAILTDDAGLARDATLGVPVVVAEDILLATARIAERFYGYPSRKLRGCLVTGTNGKTTISSLVWQLMNSAGRRYGLIGTVEIDDGSEVAPANMTTPPAIELSRTMQVMVEHGCEGVSMEASSHALDQRRCDALRIDAAIFTNLTGDHLDYHQTMENYAGAKARLFELSPPEGAAIVNSDDAWTPRMLRDCRARVVGCRVVSAGAGEACRVDAGHASAEVLSTSIHGTRLRLVGPWGRLDADVSLIGAYNAMNVLQACAAAHELGLTKDDLARALPALKAPPGRLERASDAKDPVSVFVDYAHSDDSLRQVLTAVRGVMNRSARLVVVFGCGGDRDRTKRPRMGLAAASLADRVVVTSDNPRSERPSAIIDEILGGVPAELRSKVEVQADREQAIRHAIHACAPGDVVVVAGKGHETEQVFSDGKGGLVSIHFDDREAARRALADSVRGEAKDKPPADPSRVVVKPKGRATASSAIKRSPREPVPKRWGKQDA